MINIESLDIFQIIAMALATASMLMSLAIAFILHKYVKEERKAIMNNSESRIFERSDKDLVHDAWLEVNSDPDNYNEWQYEFISDLEAQFVSKDRTTLTPKQKAQVHRILMDT